jgi:hypothetical protein
MDHITFDCRVCKKKMQFKVLDEYSMLLPPGLKCIECLGCGVLGIELLPNA